MPYTKSNISLYIYLSKNFIDILNINKQVRRDKINCANSTKIIFSSNKINIIFINSGYTNVLDVDRIKLLFTKIPFTYLNVNYTIKISIILN